MKKTDLEKQKGKKIAGAGVGASDRYGKGAAEVLDRKEQRERERELGLVPFAVKLHRDLVAKVQQEAQARGVGLSEIAAELIEKGLAAKK